MFDIDPAWENDEPLTRPNLWAIQPAADGPVPAGSRRGSRWRRWMLRVALAAVAVAVVVAGVAYWQTRSLLDEFQAGEKRTVVDSVAPELNVAPSKPAPGIGEAMNILVIGSDARAGETGGGRSDTMLLVRIDPHTNQASMLSLPRDLRVPIPGYGHNKINAAYTYGGAKLLVSTVREYFGVQIDHFFQVDFRGFGDLVDNLDGVYMPVDGRYHHVNDGTAANNWSAIDLQPGYQKLGAADALSYVRFRHLDSDFYRAARQQLFLREVGRAMKARQASVTQLPGMLRVIAKATTSDLDSVADAYDLANTLRRIPPERIRRVTLAADSLMLSGVYYLQVSETQKQEALRAWAFQAGGRAKRPAAKKRKAPPLRPADDVIADGGRGRALIAPLGGLERCAPTKLPSGFAWPSSEAARRYELDGKPAVAAYATAGSGRSLLFMWTRWQDPPILDEPTSAVKVAGRTYELWKDSGRLRQVAWRIGDTRAWVTNTLRNDLDASTMLALAVNCQPL